MDVRQSSLPEQLNAEPPLRRRIAAYIGALLLAASVPAVAAAVMFGRAWLLYVGFAIGVTHTLVLGLPLFLWLSRQGRVNVLTCMIAAFVIGVIPMAILDTIFLLDGPNRSDAWLRSAVFASICGVVGAVSGLVFWSTLRVFGVLPRAINARP